MNKKEDLYSTDKYIENNPDLHEKDSVWKIKKIIPFVDKAILSIDKDVINLLDVGGGAGIILKEVSKYIKKSSNKKVIKNSVDLSKSIIKKQKEINTDLMNTYNESIEASSIKDNSMDIALMIDVLEHIENPDKALKELKRISGYAIFKVPLENNLFYNAYNFILNNKPKKKAAKRIGHINFYNFNGLKKDIIENFGQIEYFEFANIFDYFRNSDYYKDKIDLKNRIVNFVASRLYKLSPYYCSLFFTDSVIILAKSNKNV